jgi:hypothetical protein
MLLMLPVLFALDALAAHRRQGRTAGADAPRRPEGRH